MKKSILRILVVIFFSTYSISILASINDQLKQLEVSSKGRLGISGINTANNQLIQYRADEIFPMGSTFKVVAVAAVLKTPSFLNQRVFYKKSDVVEWSPVTQNHVKGGMTVAELCEAAITHSDNTAMNLLAKKIGGLNGINAFARSLGDNSFRLDHDEPQVASSGGKGNIYDSTTPAATQMSLQKLTLGSVLGSPEQAQLIDWLKNNTTGNNRIRAGVPKDWIVGDKTGTGGAYGTTNDIAILWPPNSKPIILAIYFTHDNKKDAVKRDDVVAAATRLVIAEFSSTRKGLGCSNDTYIGSDKIED